MRSVNSTKVTSYYLRILTVYQTWQFFINLEVFRTAKLMHFRPRHTHTHKKKIQKQWLVIFPFCSGYDRFFFFLELEDVFRKFRFRARGSSFSTDFGVLHTSWFGFAFDRFRLILLRARGSPFSIE